MVNFGKDDAPRKVMVVFLYVWDWVSTRDCASDLVSIISTKSPIAVLLGLEMDGGRPWALDTSSCTVPQHGIELGLGHSQAVRSSVAWATGYWRAECCADVVSGVAVADMWVFPHTYL